MNATTPQDTCVERWRKGTLCLPLNPGDPQRIIDRASAAVQEASYDWRPEGFPTYLLIIPGDNEPTLNIDLSEVDDEERLSLGRSIVDHLVNELRWASLPAELKDALAAEDDPYA